MANIRLDKYLADCGIGTRGELKKLIKAGRVSVNGTPVYDAGTKVSENDCICVDGREMCYEEFRYFMLNKPQGCVSATRDGMSATVLDILSEENTRGLFPVGRLDKDTEGLLLITNDGQLAHMLLSPKKHVARYYIADVSEELDDTLMAKFREGLDIGDAARTLPAEIERIGERRYRVGLDEGRFHQVKRMFEACGSTVTFLKRVSMGPLVLDEKLAPGEYRRLTDDEISALRR